MAGAKGSAPNGKPGVSAKKKEEQKKQMKQLIIMAVILLVCAVLITWTVLLMKDRYRQRAELNEQSSAFEYYELSSAEDDPEQTAPTAVPEFTEATTTASTTGSTDTTVSGTTTLTNATAPKHVVTAQSVQFSKIPATATKAQYTTAAAGRTQTKNNQTTAVTERTTHTEPQQVTPDTAPTEAQIPYNELLALYLGAQAQGNAAYFIDANATSPATVVMHGAQAYRVSSSADGYSLYNWLGGTGGTDEHSWQTGVDFRLYQYESGDRYIYYTSAGDSYQVLGYYNCRTCDNVWARLHYYQVGVGWQAEYHIIHSNRPDNMNGSGTEIYNSTFDAESVYTISTEFEQQLEKELESRGMSAGNWGNYVEIKANQQSDEIWGKAGTHNNGFAPQAGETYGVVTGSGNASLYASANTGAAVSASLPAGTFLSVPKNALPVGANMVAVQAKINGTWVSGYIQPERLMAWSAQ